MQALDASSIIHAWDNYPFDQFPGLWNWLASEIQIRQLCIASVALEEVGYKLPDCALWLKAKNIPCLPMGNGVLQAAMHIKALLGIKDDNYHPKGVDENDILIIAASQYHKATLITDEKRQLGQQSNPAKRRIPAVCDMQGVQVLHQNFIEYLRQSGQVF